MFQDSSRSDVYFLACVSVHDRLVHILFTKSLSTTKTTSLSSAGRVFLFVIAHVDLRGPGYFMEVNETDGLTLDQD